MLAPQALTVLTTNRCTAACDHCCMNSGPDRRETLDAATLVKAIDELHQVKPLTVVIFAGGEPTLAKRLLHAGIRHCRSLGITTRLVTNASWARSFAKARRVLEGLREEGLDELNISADDYHLPFIPFDNVVRAWKAAKGIGFSAVIIANSAALNSRITPEYIMARLRSAATLARPRRKRDLSAVGVFTGGTGAYDRHGIASSFDIGYHQLLDDLAASGIASIRYERFDPRSAGLDEAMTDLGFEDLSAQAARWHGWTKTDAATRRAPKIVIGHSLGGLVALDLARRRADVEMAVLLATPGRTFREVTEDQHAWFLDAAGTSAAAGKESAANRARFIAALEADEDWTSDTVAPWILAQKRVRKLYRGILDLDPCELVRGGSCPVLIVQGAADVQVAKADADRLAAACGEAGRPCQVIHAADLDHLLKRTGSTGLASIRAYADRRRRVPIALIRRIAAAIKRTLA